jgi:peptidoglycan/xylan/chitin deacetylase (PgdA/CDA1 family)
MIRTTDIGRQAPEKSRLRYFVDAAGMQAVGRAGVGLDWLLGNRAPGALGIVTYHRVAPDVAGLPHMPHNVPPDRFREQLAGLLARGFTVWPLSRILACRACGEPIPPQTIAVTFDDGFQAVYTNAWPVLKELQVPATVFLSTAFLDGTDPFWFDRWGVQFADRVPAESYRPLTSEQAREMAAQGLVELGAHTHTHEDFRHRPEDFRRDLQLSVDIVRSCFDQQNVTFAFPFGSGHCGFVSDELIVAARYTGVTCGLTTENAVIDLRSDPFRWGRFTAFRWDTSATLAGKLHGWFSWAPKLRQRLARAMPCAPFRRGARTAAPASRPDGTHRPWTDVASLALVDRDEP